MQLNYDFSNHVFLTLSSGSVLNASAILGDSIPTYYLYLYVKTRNNKLFLDCETSIRRRLESLQKMGK